MDKGPEFLPGLFLVPSRESSLFLLRVSSSRFFFAKIAFPLF